MVLNTSSSIPLCIFFVFIHILLSFLSYLYFFFIYYVFLVFYLVAVHPNLVAKKLLSEGENITRDKSENGNNIKNEAEAEIEEKNIEVQGNKAKAVKKKA